ncbi:MAG: Asp-tRNA(Asn)/Glu-tRNA(Gln) amidotransferase subunit GatB [Alphaproteobacteria bacterium]
MGEYQPFTLKGKTGDWEIVIGLEVHAQIISRSKLFSRASSDFGAPANSHVALFDSALPGQLPTINQECVKQAVRTGIALQAKIHQRSVFARKNYFYADLPQGYQISQFDKPIVGEGSLTIELEDGYQKTIGIERLHLEQDAGKSIHDLSPHESYIDLNRCGVGLMEIVSKPDMNSPEEAGLYVAKLRSLLRHINSCDGNMQQGSLRADVNVSVRKMGDKNLGTRAELKNINSIKFVRDAILVEAKRQIAKLENGEKIIQETRLYDADKNQTRPMRDKEDAADYRYFPDPDLLPLVLADDFVAACQASLPPLPDEKKQQWQTLYDLPANDARQLLAEKDIADYFEAGAIALEDKTSAKAFANWILGELFAHLNKHNLSIVDSPIPPISLAGLVNVLAAGLISGKMAKEVFVAMWQSGKTAKHIISEKSLAQVSDKGEIEKWAQQVIKENPAQVADYKNGNEKLFGFLVGQLMKLSKGQANPALANQVLKDLLSK